MMDWKADIAGILDLLLASQADLHARDSRGKSPIAWSEMLGRAYMRQVLYKAGARLDGEK